ncbi:uncharacterized protein LOC119458338 isoform X1 [Dermacentor silvarum]|uniref:uncharacterized protein LOC119458338 isoform X1 n=1 Tax=Dermacentor silvarum TaxID=543639 RepID=UPI0021008D3F|nr:uncharacterized protein LOC119458338 isoform X1 [Dermacentor silvarum]
MFHGRSPRTRTPYHVCCMAFVKAGSEFWTIVATAALLLLIVLAESDAYSPIRHAVHQGARAQRGPYFSGRGSYSLQVKKSRGGVCHSTNECKEEYCCVERQHVQTCQPYSIFGERCTIPQIRGGGYHDACPCAAGNRALLMVDGTFQLIYGAHLEESSQWLADGRRCQRFSSTQRDFMTQSSTTTSHRPGPDIPIKGYGRHSVVLCNEVRAIHVIPFANKWPHGASQSHFHRHVPKICLFRPH